MGDKVFHGFVYDIVDEDPTAGVTEQPLRAEIDLLSRVADLTRKKEIELLWHTESRIEFWGIYMVPGGGSSELVDAGVTEVDGPIEYARMLSPILPRPEQTWRTTQIEFLARLRHTRFYELQIACGAYQGSKVNANQLLDAFHIWCAEKAGATHFLTTDFKLIRNVRGHKKAPPRVLVVKPSELLAEIDAKTLSS